jgi:hypothetical protein
VIEDALVEALLAEPSKAMAANAEVTAAEVMAKSAKALRHMFCDIYMGYVWWVGEKKCLLLVQELPLSPMAVRRDF